MSIEGYRRRHVKENRSISEARRASLTKAQRELLDRATSEWQTAKALRTTNRACNSLAQIGLLLTSVKDGVMVYKSRQDRLEEIRTIHSEDNSI